MAASPADNTLPVHAEITDDELAEIGTILSMWRSFNMSAYKDKCMKRRVAIRMRSTRCRDAAEYCNLLRQSPQELDLLQKALTIHVSQFFRNPSMFDKLRDEVLPGLFSSCETNGAGTAALLVSGLRRRRRTFQPGDPAAGTFQQGDCARSRRSFTAPTSTLKPFGPRSRPNTSKSASRRSLQISRIAISGRTDRVFAWCRRYARW